MYTIAVSAVQKQHWIEYIRLWTLLQPPALTAQAINYFDMITGPPTDEDTAGKYQMAATMALDSIGAIRNFPV